MNFSGHEMLDAAGLSLTESEPWAELGSTEEGGTERQDWHETAAGVGMRECFLQHQRTLLEGNGYSLEKWTFIPVQQHDRPPLFTLRISNTDPPSFILTLSALLKRLFGLITSRNAPVQSKWIITC